MQTSANVFYEIIKIFRKKKDSQFTKIKVGIVFPIQILIISLLRNGRRYAHITTLTQRRTKVTRSIYLP